MFSALSQPKNHKDVDELGLDHSDIPDDVMSDHFDQLVAIDEADARHIGLISAAAALRTYGVSDGLIMIVRSIDPTICQTLPTQARVKEWTEEERLKEGVRLAHEIDTNINEAMYPTIEGYIGDQLSTWRTKLHFNKKTIVASIAITAALVNKLVLKNTLDKSIARPVIASAAIGTTLALIDKAANIGHVYGSYNAVDALISDIEKRGDLIEKLHSVEVPKEDNEWPGYADQLKHLAPILTAFGYQLSDTYISYKRTRKNPAAQMRMFKFSESGWDPENFVKATQSYKKSLERVHAIGTTMSRIVDTYETMKLKVRGEEATAMLSRLISSLMVDQVTDAKLADRSLKDASRFFTVKQLRVVQQ